MRQLLYRFTLLTLVFLPLTAAATPLRVKEVIDSATLLLENGEEVRLADVITPFQLELPDYEQEAVEYLASIAVGKTVQLDSGDQRRDRHGRYLAQVWVEGGGCSPATDTSTCPRERNWLQGELLSKGYALIYSYSELMNYRLSMVILEHDSRGKQRGIWQEPSMAVLDATRLSAYDPARYQDKFKLVKGRVKEVVGKKKYVYINFGDDWKTDFTVSLEKSYVPDVEKVLGRLDALVGKPIQVRGWLEERNGPLVRLMSPSQIEIVSGTGVN